MREFQVCGLGNAIVDLFVSLEEKEFAELGFERGTMRLVDYAEQVLLLDRLSGASSLASGGSVCNSLIALAQLGGKSAMYCCVGDDRYGHFYSDELTNLGVSLGVPPLPGMATGTAACIITPDAERTMRTCLAASSHLAEEHIHEDLIARSDMLFIEGYVFANPETGQSAIRRALQIARQHGTKIVLTCSDAFVPAVFGDAFREAMDGAYLLFANSTEARGLANVEDTVAAFDALRAKVPNVVVTDGAHGAHISWHGEVCHVPAFHCEPKDLTGAGDIFAGAFLYGVTHGISAEKAGRAANYLAKQVITQVGARLHTGAKEFWNEMM